MRKVTSSLVLVEFLFYLGLRLLFFSSFYVNSLILKPKQLSKSNKKYKLWRKEKMKQISNLELVVFSKFTIFKFWQFFFESFVFAWYIPLKIYFLSFFLDFFSYRNLIHTLQSSWKSKKEKLEGKKKMKIRLCRVQTFAVNPRSFWFVVFEKVHRSEM